MLDWIETIFVKFIMWNGGFTIIEKQKGRYWEDGFEIINKSDKDHWVLVIKEQE